MGAFKTALSLPFSSLVFPRLGKGKYDKQPRELMGLQFVNPVGLAAGFDKDGKYFDTMGRLGFGFVEIGTITPEMQEGNPLPRIFRLPEDRALINRLGFNNEGARACKKRLEKKQKPEHLIIGANIGKNKWIPNEEAYKDYEFCFEQLFPYVDYFVVNVSSPNTPDLRALQEKEPLERLLSHLQGLNQLKDHPKPLLLKVAPDLGEGQLEEIAEIVKKLRLEGMIVSNTTIRRKDLHSPEEMVSAIGKGGLSGAPLFERSTEMIKQTRRLLGDEFIIIGVGGIDSPEKAKAKLDAGADLIQLYSGMIYEGPGLIRRILKHLKKN